MDEKNEAFQRKFGDKNCGMSSKLKEMFILLKIFTVNDKTVLIYLSKDS